MKIQERSCFSISSSAATSRVPWIQMQERTSFHESSVDVNLEGNRHLRQQLRCQYTLIDVGSPDFAVSVIFIYCQCDSTAPVIITDKRDVILRTGLLRRFYYPTDVLLAVAIIKMAVLFYGVVRNSYFYLPQCDII